MWRYLNFTIFFGLFNGVLLSDCNLYTEDAPDTPIPPCPTCPIFSAGKIRKTFTSADHIPGFTTGDLKLKDWNAAEGCNQSFFSFVQNEKTIVVTVPDNFAQVVDEFRNNDTNPPTEVCSFRLRWDTSGDCTSGSFSKVSYTISDVNMAAPKFTQTSYALTVPFPLGQGLIINQALEVDIISEDTDFSTKAIKYEIQGGSSDFELVTKPKNVTNFPVDIKTTRFLNFESEVTLTIIATDDGSDPGPMTSTATIVITPDADNSVPPTPEFKQPLYQGNIKNTSLVVGNKVFTTELSESYTGTLKIEVVSNDKFEVTAENGSTTLYSITVAKEPENPDEAYHVIQLKSTLSNGHSEAVSFTTVVLGVESEPLPPSSSSESPSSSSESPSSSSGSPSSTESPTSSGSTSSGSTSSSTDRPDDDDESKDDCGSDSGLIAATVIFAICTACLAVVVGYGYFKYVRKPTVIQPTSAGHPTSSYGGTGGFENLAYVDEKAKSEGLKPTEEKTRKRSMTFSHDDEESRVNRERGSNADSLQSNDESEKTAQEDPKITSL